MTDRPSFRQALNRAVAERRLLVVPGAYDALSALLIERAGFDTMFIGGFPVAGARYGVPDIGLKGFADIAWPSVIHTSSVIHTLNELHMKCGEGKTL